MRRHRIRRARGVPALVHRILAPDWIADIYRVVIVALGAERAETFGSEQLAGAEVEDSFALAPVQRRVFEADGNGHVGADLQVGVCAVHIVVQVAIFVEERADKRFLYFLGERVDFRHVCGLLSPYSRKGLRGSRGRCTIGH